MYSIKKVSNYNKNLPSGPSHCSSNCTTHLFLFVWVLFKRCNSPTRLKLQPSAEESSLTRTAEVHKKCSLECTKKEVIFEVTSCPLRPPKHAQRQRNKLETGVSDMSKSESSIRANTSPYPY